MAMGCGNGLSWLHCVSLDGRRCRCTGVPHLPDCRLQLHVALLRRPAACMCVDACMQSVEMRLPLLPLLLPLLQIFEKLRDALRTQASQRTERRHRRNI